jgi:hypothetical protein
VAKIRTSQIVAVVVIVIVASRLILWVRGETGTFPVAECFPLLGGHTPSWAYDALGGGTMLLIVLLAFRLRR